MDIKEAIGKWPGIFSALGVDVGTGKHKPCVLCGGKDRFRFDDKDGMGTYICGQCGAGDGWTLIQKSLNIDFKEAVKVVEGVIGNVPKSKINNGLQYRPELLREMYKDSKPLDGKCLGSLYLKNRGLKTIPASLRFLPDCYEPSTQTKIPAILATFSAQDSEALTLHRIFLKEGGHKADIEKCKLTMTPKKPMSGGAVRLFDAVKEVGITEGIETAIAVHEMYNISVWATLTTSLLVAFEPPKGIENITIFADADLNYAGEKAAYSLANKLYLKGFAVGVKIPRRRGCDFLDMLTENHET